MSYEPIDILTLEPAAASWSRAVSVDGLFVRPVSHCVGMNLKEIGYVGVNIVDDSLLGRLAGFSSSLGVGASESHDLARDIQSGDPDPLVNTVVFHYHPDGLPNDISSGQDISAFEGIMRARPFRVSLFVFLIQLRQCQPEASVRHRVLALIQSTNGETPR